ncbi:MAG: hypothetical protein IT324_31395 [Anaerolineae bacterium]|nr:hypothetical protein [Anaerolineae bacterium]
MVVNLQVIAANIRAHFWIVLASSLIALLSVVNLTVILVSRATLPAVSDIPETLLPGHVMPDDVSCVPSPYSGERVSCRVLSGDNDLIYVTFDAKGHVIRRVSMLMDRQSIGDLIRVWGPPTGIKKMRWAMQVQWGMRYVYVSAQPFSPENGVGFVSYDLDLDGVAPWKGFTDSGY